jgi:hypothetical protein
MEPYAKHRHGTVGGGGDAHQSARANHQQRPFMRGAAATSPRINLVCDLDPDEGVRRQEVLTEGRKKGHVQIEIPRRHRRPTPPPTPAPP